MTVPILNPVRWRGHGNRRWIVLGACEDRVGGNVWLVRAVAQPGGTYRPDWNYGQQAARINDLKVIVPK